jgi:hypothetical protein
MAPVSYTRMSPGMYRSSTGQNVRSAVRPMIPKVQKPVVPGIANVPSGTQTILPTAGTTNTIATNSPTSTAAVNGTATTSTAKTLADLQARRAEIIRRSRAKGNVATPGYDKLRHGIDAEIEAYRKANPAAPAAPATPAAPVDTSAQDAYAQQIADIMFADTKGFGDNAAYVQAQTKGQDALTKMMAARGLSGGGAEIQGNADFLANLNAEESTRVNNAMQTKAERLKSILETESMRKERAANTQYDQTMRAIEVMLSQSPMSMAYDATGKSAGLTQDQYNSLAQFLAQNYSKKSGGGASTPFPSAPNTSQSDMLKAILDGQNNTGDNSIFSKILGALTK